MVRSTYIHANLMAMQLRSWIVFWFSVFVVFLFVLEEIRDILLCNWLLCTLHTDAPASLPWRGGLLLVRALRQFGLVPVVAWMNIAVLTGESISAQQMIFNAVGILFMFDVDNAIYEHLLSDGAKIEAVAKNPMVLCTVELCVLSRARNSYLLATVLG